MDKHDKIHEAIHYVFLIVVLIIGWIKIPIYVYNEFKEIKTWTDNWEKKKLDESCDNLINEICNKEREK
ncbi:hypothetical protein [Helicobacter labetoulli]|uniref:hypothetical protein n=1 Tax=Helicobacter labetoulli TaxID=2315333 RepID=UPI000EF64F61|nr:hypothetical protein [Helicobacter labetoulli]